jgi:hypothetical protein
MGSMTTPAEARAAFLWRLVTPWQVYDAIRRLPVGERADLTREAAARLGVSERTIQRRVARFWPVAVEPQEPGGLHRVRCTNDPCDCDEVILI